DDSPAQTQRNSGGRNAFARCRPWTRLCRGRPAGTGSKKIRGVESAGEETLCTGNLLRNALRRFGRHQAGDRVAGKGLRRARRRLAVAECGPDAGWDPLASAIQKFNFADWVGEIKQLQAPDMDILLSEMLGPQERAPWNRSYGFNSSLKRVSARYGTRSEHQPTDHTQQRERGQVVSR